MIARVTTYENGDQFVVLCDEHPRGGPCLRYMLWDKASGITAQIRLADFHNGDPTTVRNKEFDDQTNDEYALNSLRTMFAEIRAQSLTAADQTALDKMAVTINRSIAKDDTADEG